MKRQNVKLTWTEVLYLPKQNTYVLKIKLLGKNPRTFGPKNPGFKKFTILGNMAQFRAKLVNLVHVGAVTLPLALFRTLPRGAAPKLSSSRPGTSESDKLFWTVNVFTGWGLF